MRHERYSVRMRTDVQSVTQHDHERVGFDEIDSNQRLQTLRKHDTTSGLLVEALFGMPRTFRHDTRGCAEC